MNKRIGIFFPIAILVTGCLYPYRLEVPETRTWPAEGISSISASTKNGGITVCAAEEPNITAHITKRCYGRNKEDAEKYLKNVVIKDTIISGQLSINTEMPSGNRNYGAEFEISSPESTHLDLSTTNTEISLTNMTAGANLSTSNNAVSLKNTQGQINISTSNGKVLVQVHHGGIEARTSNGEIDCDIAKLDATESIILETSNDKVLLRLPQDVSATFDLTTSNGEITVTGFNSIRYDTQERTHKTGTIGSGASTITISTSNGDIIICAR